MDFSDNYLLTLGTFLPLVGVLVMMFIPAAEEKLHKQIAIVVSGATLAVGIWTMALFDYDRANVLQFAVDEKWIEVIRANYTIGVDGISLPLYILSMFVTFLVVIYSWNNMPDGGNPKAFLMVTLVLRSPSRLVCLWYP